MYDNDPLGVVRKEVEAMEMPKVKNIVERERCTGWIQIRTQDTRA